MARAELRRLSEQQMMEAVLLEEYHQGVSSQVVAVQSRFDAKIAQKIGFSGNILETMKDHLVKDDSSRVFLSGPIPEQIEQYLETNEYGNVIFEYTSKSSSYKVEPGHRISDISMASDTAELKFTAGEEAAWSISAKVKGPYNWSRTSEPTERSIFFPTNSHNPYEVLTIGQKKDDVSIVPLIYGDLDTFGNAHLHLDQPIHAHGVHVTTELTDGLVIKAKDKKFYFPLAVNWQHELAEISGRLL